MGKRPTLPQGLNVPSQDNQRRATKLAFETASGQEDEQLLWLGAEPDGAVWRLPVLNDVLEIDLAARRVLTSSGDPVCHAWRRGQAAG